MEGGPGEEVDFVLDLGNVVWTVRNGRETRALFE